MIDKANVTIDLAGVLALQEVCMKISDGIEFRAELMSVTAKAGDALMDIPAEDAETLAWKLQNFADELASGELGQDGHLWAEILIADIRRIVGIPEEGAR